MAIRIDFNLCTKCLNVIWLYSSRVITLFSIHNNTAEVQEINERAHSIRGFISCLRSHGTYNDIITLRLCSPIMLLIGAVNSASLHQCVICFFSGCPRHYLCQRSPENGRLFTDEIPPACHHHRSIFCRLYFCSV